jgi:hypothetical protein
MMTSFFTGFNDKNPKMISIYDFVTSTDYKDVIERIRETGNMDLKSTLPFITPGCICEGGHKKVISKSGCISIDFDNGSKGTKNIHITDWVPFIMSLKDFNNIYFAGLSASGRGGYAIIRLEYPEMFMESFLGIQYSFKHQLGVEIEKGCHNVNRLRFASFNTPETSFINTEAVGWRYLVEQARVKIGKPFESGTVNIALFRSMARHIEIRANNPQSFASGSRHAFTIALAGACAWAGIPVEQCVEWISDEYWSKEPDYLSRIDSELRGIGDAYIHAERTGRAK